MFLIVVIIKFIILVGNINRKTNKKEKSIVNKRKEPLGISNNIPPTQNNTKNFILNLIDLISC